MIVSAWSSTASRTSLVSILLRGVQIAIVALIIVWVVLLGGLRFTPTPKGDGNDTGLLFNWHPLLMTLAFIVCMGEAVLAYKAPVLRLSDRPARKTWHVTMHTAAFVLGSLGIVAAIQSHNLKRPNPVPNFYSTHSFLGLLVCSMLVLQATMGMMAFVAPKWSVQTRQEFGPLHAFSGLLILITGIGTMAVGIQEKTTFIQFTSNAPDVRSAVMRVPAIIQLFLVFFAFGIVYYHWQSRMQTPVMQPVRPTQRVREDVEMDLDLDLETEALYDGRP